MGLVRIARYYDVAEAQIAWGALRANGIDCHLQNAEWAANDVRWTIGMGGVGLWVLTDEAIEATTFLSACRVDDPEARDWRRHPKVWTGVPVALLTVFFLGGGMGWLVAAARQQPTAWRLWTVAAVISVYVMSVSIIVAAWLAY